MTKLNYQLVTTADAFNSVVEKLATAERYAIDTEFHRERTYFPQVALVQLTAGDDIWMVDPLEVDLAPLAKVLDGDGLCLIHAGSQDLEVLDLVCDTAPKQIFDTQIAAGFIGVSSGSLASLVNQFLGVHLPKGDRLTDWLRRPLTGDQLSYAASDVEHLHRLTDAIQAKLKDLGRQEWVDEECQLLLDRPRGRRVPEDAILRLKEARNLSGESFRVGASVAAWRERRAAEANVPVRQVLSDLGVVAVSQRAPTTVKQLKNLRGVEQRHLKNGADTEILTAVRAAQTMELSIEPNTNRSQLSRQLRPVVSLITAWVSQLARDNKLDPAILATRADIEGLLRKDPSCRLNFGWRQALVGNPIDQLVSGSAAVAFNGDGRLTLEARSGRELSLENGDA